MTRIHLIDAHTVLYGIIGKPVRHSLSPAMHNAAFQHEKINAVYLAFETDDCPQACSSMRCLDIKGYSVTIPNKEDIVPLLDKTDHAVQKIGACNTIKNVNGTLVGTNTDWLGAITALEKSGITLKGAKTVILGAGGSARAVAYGLLEREAKVTICNRTLEKAQQLALEFGCEYASLSEAEKIHADILVNTTSVGMANLSDKSPISKKGVENYQIIMDIVYNPLETVLLRYAKAAGKITINGLYMLLYQAMAQFEYWTGQKAPEKIMRKALEYGVQ